MFIKVFTWFLLASGFALAAFGLYFAFLGAEARSWPEVEGTIDSVTVRTDISIATGTGVSEGAREQRRLYYPAIGYSYTVDGQTHSSTLYRLGDGDVSKKYREREDAVAAAAKYRNGDAIPVFYNPEDPSTAVLDRSASFGVYVPLLLGAFFLGTGALFHRNLDALVAAAEK